MRRTTRLDVGLALAFAGVAYLVWGLVAGMSRSLVQEAIRSAAFQQLRLANWLHILFVDGGFMLDLAGLGWLVLSLLLVVLGSRQRISISWAWAAAVCQVCVAALGAVLVAWAAYQPHVLKPDVEYARATQLAEVSKISLHFLMPVAVVIWVTFLVWLLVEHARFKNRRGPTLTDGLRTHR